MWGLQLIEFNTYLDEIGKSARLFVNMYVVKIMSIMDNLEVASKCLESHKKPGDGRVSKHCLQVITRLQVKPLFKSLF